MEPSMNPSSGKPEESSHQPSPASKAPIKLVEVSTPDSYGGANAKGRQDFEDYENDNFESY